MRERPLVSISLVTYNGERWLDACLTSVARQTTGDFEMIVIDNASTDRSAGIVDQWTRRDDRMRLVRSESNLGYARGHNLGIAAARGEYVCLLNQDVVLDRRFLSEVVSAFLDPALGAVQGKLYRLGPSLERTSVIDSTGLVIQRNRRITSRGQGQPDGTEFDAAGPVFGVDGACPVYRARALEDARVPLSRGAWEILDEDFFMYKEDVDLAWRLHLLGWRTHYAPRARAWHARSAGESAARSVRQVIAYRRRIPSWIKATSWKNQRLMQVKNEVSGELLRDAPLILAKEVAAIGYLAAFSPRSLPVVATLLRQLPAAMRKRRHIQARRQVRGVSRWLR
jgi:GT2 family glycosyltransferase